MSARRLILASSSPRRSLLLSAAGFTFTTMTPDVDESPSVGEPPMEYVLRVAGDKASVVDVEHDDVVVAADTTVVLEGEMIGKPSDADEALEMLEAMTGRTHLVLTGWTVATAHDVRFGVEESAVRFNERTREELAAYVERTNPFDKAGAYALQGDDGWLVASVEGSRSNVMGLPIRPIVEALDALGVRRSPE